MLKYSQIPHAFNSIFLLFNALFRKTSVVVACHQYAFNIAYHERKRTQ